MLLISAKNNIFALSHGIIRQNIGNLCIFGLDTEGRRVYNLWWHTNEYTEHGSLRHYRRVKLNRFIFPEPVCSVHPTILFWEIFNMDLEMMHPADRIVTIMNRLYNYGMTTTSGGNLSVCDPDGTVWISPSGIDKGSLRRRGCRPDKARRHNHRPAQALERISFPPRDLRRSPRPQGGSARSPAGSRRVQPYPRDSGHHAHPRREARSAATSAWLSTPSREASSSARR